MIELTFDNGKTLITFRIEGTKVFIKDRSTQIESVFNAKTFEEQQKNKRAEMQIRRKKGEAFLTEWKKDFVKFTSFRTEEEIEADIMKDFHKKKGRR